MPRKKHASIVDTLLSVKGVARLLRNITVQDRLGPDSTVASSSNSLGEQSSTDRRSRRTSKTSKKRCHRHCHTSKAVLESDSRYALFQDSRNDFAEPSIGSQSARRSRTIVQLPTQRGARSSASSSPSAAKSESLRNHMGYRHKIMREDTDLESSGSERVATRQRAPQSGRKDDDRSNHESVFASAAETANTNDEPLRDHSSGSDDDQYQTKRVHDGRSYPRQFTKQLPRRQVRFVKSNAHLRGLVDIKLSPPKYEKFEAHYQMILAQKQTLGSSAPEKLEFPSPKTSSDAPSISSQSAVPQVLTAPSMPASPASTKPHALSQATVRKSKTESEVSVSMGSPSALRTNTSTTAATISSAWASIDSSPTTSRAPSYTSTRAPSHTAPRALFRAASRASSLTVSKAPSHMASRAPSRSSSRVLSRTTSRASKIQQNGHDSFINSSAAASVQLRPSSQKSISTPVGPVMPPHSKSTNAAPMSKSPVNEKHPHEQPGEKVDESCDKQHNVQVNEGQNERDHEHVEEQLGQHTNEQATEQAKEQRNKQPCHHAKDSVSTCKETTHGGHAMIPDAAINDNGEIRSIQCHLQGLLPEVYDCKYKTRHCYACSRPRDMRYVDFRNRLCPGEEPQRSLCRTCRRCLDRNQEFSLVPYTTNKRTLNDIKKFHWCPQCGTIRSQPFHKHYPSGTEVPPRHQLCYPCCNLAKFPPKSGSSTYKLPREDGDASNNNRKKRAGGDEKGQAGNSPYRPRDIRSADYIPQDGPAVVEPLPSNIPAEETHSPKPSTPVVSPDPGYQHHPSKSHAMTEASAAQTGAESSSQTQTPRPAVGSTSVKHDSPGGSGDFNSESWKIPADDSPPPPQRKRSTTDSSYGQSSEGQFYENIQVNYHEILGQDRTKHHRDCYDASLPEILLTTPNEEAHVTRPTILDEQSPGGPLHDNLPRFSWKDSPPRGRSKNQRQPSMQSQESNQTVRPSDDNFSSCRNKENYPESHPQYTTPRRFHWPIERGEVVDDQPKGLSDMFYETDEGKRADAFFASMSNWSEPKPKPKTRAESTDNFNTWPPSSYDTMGPAVYEYLEKRRSKRPSVIPGSSPHGHVRKASDSLSVETVGLWQGVTPGAPIAEVTEPESPAGEEVSHIACRVHPSRKMGAKKDSGSAASIF
ncbi:hypothetical protein QBC32DRAFT_202838 [Pseudoneurospora amorphoporcata]|uniref:Uncharacterized protein n=1 Tax=Pseudoneurospora amorphoporcata TaxID=241081 RepID=A0AAN6P687_9PEZI|nr:hypothetical protein QBC32DRAFT_202838 [Pseudoneurospora amorphoporcata]